MSFRLYSGTSTKQACFYSGHLSVACTFYWNHETELNYTVKKSNSYKKINYSGQFMAYIFLRLGLKVLSQKNLYIADGTKKLYKLY